jgi:hypothetical protein
MKRCQRGINVALFFFMVLTSSCTQNKKIERQIEQLCEMAIRIDVDSMVACNVSDSVLLNPTGSNLKMIIWADSTECSQCYIRHLDYWKGYMKLENENPDGIQFYYILETAPEKMEEMISLIQTTQLEHVIYVDTMQLFRRNNPNIPSDVLFHSFLLDSDNKVVLVGNPTRNKGIQNLFNRILDEKLGISMKDEDSL